MIWILECTSSQCDAQLLARLGLADAKRPCPIHHRGETTQRDLVLLKVREGLVKARMNALSLIRLFIEARMKA